MGDIYGPSTPTFLTEEEISIGSIALQMAYDLPEDEARKYSEVVLLAVTERPLKRELHDQ